MDKSFISKDQWNHPCCVAIQTNNQYNLPGWEFGWNFLLGLNLCPPNFNLGTKGFFTTGCLGKGIFLLAGTDSSWYLFLKIYHNCTYMNCKRKIYF